MTTLASTTVAGLLDGRRRDRRVAFVDGITRSAVTWEEVARRAAFWRDPTPRLPAGCRVGLAFSEPVDMAMAFLGAVAAGYSVAPIPPTSTAPEALRQVAAMGLGAVVTGPGDVGPLRSALRARGVDLWSFDPGGIQSAGSRTAPGGVIDGGGAALLLASSGTTGSPKLIPLTERQLVATAQAVATAHGLTPDDRCYSPLPLSHINGLVVGVLATIVSGQRLVLDRRFSASQFWSVAEREEVTWCNLVPAILAVLADLPAPPDAVARRVRFARSASAPLPVATLAAFEATTGIGVVETYGMTEVASQITANPIEPGERRPGSVGRPVDVDLRVVGPDGHPLPAGEAGEVQLRGDRVVEVYWSPQDQGGGVTPARSRGGWLATGDLGHLDADGFVHLLGRVGDVINRGGEKVLPEAVEAVLAAEPGVAAVAVVGRPHPTLGAEPVAFVVVGADHDPVDVVARLGARAGSHLSPYRRPSEFIVVEAIPSGTNGKIRRAELRASLEGDSRRD